MVGDVSLQQVVAVILSFNALDGAVSSDKPSLPRRIASSIHFQSQEVFESSINFFPFLVFAAPTDDKMCMARIETSAFESPSFIFTNRMHEQEQFALARRVENDFILFGVSIVLLCHLRIRRLNTLPLRCVSPWMIRSPVSIGVIGEVINRHARNRSHGCKSVEIFDRRATLHGLASVAAKSRV